MTRGLSTTLSTQLPARYERLFAWQLDRRCKAPQSGCPLRRHAAEDEREAGIRGEPLARDHHGLIHCRAVFPSPLFGSVNSGRYVRGPYRVTRHLVGLRDRDNDSRHILCRHGDLVGVPTLRNDVDGRRGAARESHHTNADSTPHWLTNAPKGRALEWLLLRRLRAAPRLRTCWNALEHNLAVELSRADGGHSLAGAALVCQLLVRRGCISRARTSRDEHRAAHRYQPHVLTPRQRTCCG